MCEPSPTSQRGHSCEWPCPGRRHRLHIPKKGCKNTAKLCIWWSFFSTYFGEVGRSELTCHAATTHGSWVPLVTHQIGGTESRSEDICIATCATSKADWSAWTHSTVFVMPLHKQVVWLCVILIVWVYTIYRYRESKKYVLVAGRKAEVLHTLHISYWHT